MKIVLYTNSVSAHQLPLAREIVRRVGPDEFRYVYTGQLQGGGQEVAATEPWIVREDERTRQLLESCEVLLSGNRALEVFERRVAAGRTTLYMSERWFKPLRLCRGVWLPGRTRLLVPRFRAFARRVAALSASSHFRYLAIGPWARQDMQRLGVPAAKIVDWGYFVAPSAGRHSPPAPSSRSCLRILWVGRLLDWKRVETLVKSLAERAIVNLADRRVCLTLVGDGPERHRLMAEAKRVAARSPNAEITFLPPLPLDGVRELMRQHDVYVLASDAAEGWGAALNEALEEGMIGLGTHEAGASAALLPDEQRYPAGDARALAALLASVAAGGTWRRSVPQDYTPQGAAERLFSLVRSMAEETA